MTPRFACARFAWPIATLLFVSLATAADKKPTQPPDAFGSLQTPSVDKARNQAHDWLKATGKMDARTQQAFAEIWQQPERPVLNRVSDTLALGDAGAAKLLEEARDPSTPAPKDVPSLIKDTKLPGYFRANLALAYAKALSNRRVYEEALDALAAVKPEQVVDPAAYFFHRAVAEHALIRRDDAIRSIARLLDDVTDAPDRYRLVALLMFVDMQGWKEKDLDWIARKMGNIERRLDLARGGPQTQKIQREVVARLDEIIKELENQKNGNCNCNGGSCPNGGSGSSGGANPSSPMRDSNIANNGGPGKVDEKRLKQLAEVWGKLPEKDRAKAMTELTRDMPPRYRELIESYLRKQAQTAASER